ncbi:DUF6236 family protein [Klebsiella pneumoniae]|uniref:DUF6236 family protein n=1 Tax=Klebsiella pneumoniae TaxID=573 RepID=UPI0021CE5C41|nr:DUF6236 family protein [Klebsiella pneumoniae]MCU6584924.1 DUF6236 family protein [Klebsiella pneumoniae]
MKRGIVSIPMEISTSEDGLAFIGGSGLNTLDLNFFAMYWDELIIPASDLVYLGINDEEPFIEAGFLQRPKIPRQKNSLTGDELISAYSNAQTYWLDAKRKEDKSSDWRMSIVGDNFRLFEGGSDIQQTFRLELARALPVPDTSVNINEILEFKHRWSSEHEAFNSYLDELYLDVVSSGDFNLAKSKAFERLNKSLADLERLNEEGWRSPIRFDTSALLEINIGDMKDAAAAFYAILEAHHGDVKTAIALGACALAGQGIARLKPCIQSVRRKPELNIAYLSKAHKRGIT